MKKHDESLSNISTRFNGINFNDNGDIIHMPLGELRIGPLSKYDKEDILKEKFLEIF